MGWSSKTVLLLPLSLALLLLLADAAVLRASTTLLDVSGSLKSLEQSTSDDRLDTAGGAVVVHRSSLVSRDSGSVKDLMNARLERDAARVEAIEHRLSRATAASPGYQRDEKRRSNFKANNSSRSPSLASGDGRPVTSGLRFGSGEYFVRMEVGTPARRLYLVMDTGSDVPWVQCSPCKSCYKQLDAVFDPSKSSSYSRLSCSSTQCNQLDTGGCDTGGCLYQVAYGDGSFTIGDLAVDSFDGTKVAFGCGHDNEGLFAAADGLLGMGAGKLSYPTQTGGAAAKFSYCLVVRNGARASSPLLFGASAVPNGAGFVFTRLLRNPRLDTFYYTGLTGFSVGGVRVPISASTFRLNTATGRGGVIVDSGTSVTRLPTSAYTGLRDAFRAATRNLKQAPGFSLFDTCYDLSGLTSVTVPTVKLHFDGGAGLQLPAGNYLVPVDTSGTFCFAFAKTSMELSIIGNIQQQTIRVAIDLGAQRVGFAANGC